MLIFRFVEAMNSNNNSRSSSVSTTNRKYCSTIRTTFLVIISLMIILVINIERQISISRIYTSFAPIQQKYQQKQIRSLESFICDHQIGNRFPSSSTTAWNDSFDGYRKTILQTYCDIVPNPTRGWIRAKTYTEKDIAFVIFTGVSFFHTRATATRDTWLSRITNYYFLSETPYPYLPVTIVPNAGEDKLSNMKKLFYGLKIIYQQQMNLSLSHQQKWFYIIGCDTFILPHHLVKRLDNLDYRKPILVGGHSDKRRCLGNMNHKLTVDFPSGGAGFFLSVKLLEMMQPHLISFVENIWPKTSDASDVAFACLAAQLGVRLTKQVGFWAHSPAFTLRESGYRRFHKYIEPNNFHYIKPDEMYALDEFYVNQHIDRLINDENWSEFIEFTRRFISSHYELLRKKRRECTLPQVVNETTSTISQI